MCIELDRTMSTHLQHMAFLAALTVVCLDAAAASTSIRAVASPAPEQVAAANDDSLLLLQAGIFDPTRERLQINGLALAQAAFSPYVVVQYHSNQVPSADQLRKRGFQVLGYLPHNAFQLKLSGEQRSDLASDRAVRFLGDWQPAYKLAPQLRPGSPLRAPGAVHLVDVYGHSGEAQGEFEALLDGAAAGIGKVRAEQRMGRPFVRLQIDNSSLDSALTALANEQQVSWIERFEQPQLHNADSVGPIQANVASGANPTAVASIWAKGIIGSGQIVAVTDGGLDRNEGWFNRLNKGAGVMNGITNAEATTPPAPGTLFPNNKVIGYWVMPGASAYDDNQVCVNSSNGFHGTHVAGSVAGDSGTASTPTAPNYDASDGMAPNAQILFQDGGKDSTGCLSGLEAALRPMWEQAQAGGAFISNNSYGADFAGAYTGLDADLDEMAWLNEQFLVVVSAGNQGALGISHPSHAKHSLSVGLLGSGISTDVPGFSGRGPTVDGRLKPDIQAPGALIASAHGNDDDSNPPANPNQANAVRKTGTSMSGPIVAGGAALVRQYFEDGFYPSGSKRAADTRKLLGAELKALLLNGTAFIGNGASATTTTPGNALGWGRIFLDNNLFFTGDARDVRTWALTKDNGIRTGEDHEYQVQVTAGAEFRATLVWYDPPGNFGTARALVNNLDLEVATPDGTLLGNVFPSTGTNTQTNPGGTADEVNTVEQVKINVPTAGTYTIRVKGTAVPGNQYLNSSRQGYALVTSQAAVATAVTSAPAAPTFGNSGGNVAVTSGAVAGASTYQYYRATGSCASAIASDFQFIGKSSGPSFTDTGTEGGVTYAYKVRGADAGGEGPISACGEPAILFTDSFEG